MKTKPKPKKQRLKSLNVSIPTWKKVMQAKLDRGFDSQDQVIVDFIERDGYY